VVLFSISSPKDAVYAIKGQKWFFSLQVFAGKNCFYGPVSNERREKDKIFANERPVNRDEDLIEEAISMDALGTGITVGNPF